MTPNDARPVTVTEPVLLIRINRLYRHGMSNQELYEATRGVWKLNEKRARAAQYALAVYEGVVREVYRIHSWHPAGSLIYDTRPPAEVKVADRWEFEGTVAEPAIRNKYMDQSVSDYFPHGFRFPVKYVLC